MSTTATPRNEEDELAAAIAASLADQGAGGGVDERDDIKRAIAASTTPVDLNALTAAEQDQLTVAQMNNILSDIQTTPMVGDRVGVLSALRAEYARNPMVGFARGIEALDARYASLRRVRKDGNCFYRGFLYRYLEHLCSTEASARAASASPCAELVRIKALVAASKAKILGVGYEESAIDMFWEMFGEALDDVGKLDWPAWHAKMNEEHGVSMHLVWFMRILSATHMKMHADRFAPFCMDETGACDVSDFCAREVEPVNRECEQVQIIALTEMLDIPVAIEYLDGTSDAPSRLVFPDGSSPVVELLYRPGHYDVLYAPAN